MILTIFLSKFQKSKVKTFRFISPFVFDLNGIFPDWVSCLQWRHKYILFQKVAINKKSSILIQIRWNLAKLIHAWAKQSDKVSLNLDHNCTFLLNTNFKLTKQLFSNGQLLWRHKRGAKSVRSAFANNCLACPWSRGNHRTPSATWQTLNLKQIEKNCYKTDITFLLWFLGKLLSNFVSYLVIIGLSSSSTWQLGN